MADDPQLLYPFKYFDEIRKRWMQARYRATRETIASTYAKWEITGPGQPPSNVGGFKPPEI